MPPKVRQRGKKPSKLRKLQQEQEEQPEASTSSPTPNQISAQADFIPLNDDAGKAQPVVPTNDQDETPNWVKLGDRPGKAEHEAPFGYVDAELKAYLRSGWERVVELESQGYVAKSTLTVLSATSGAARQTDVDGENQEDDELALLLQATLKEMDGKELLLTTDPDTSLIVEGILHRLPAKPLRVFVDRLAGNFVTLAKHRFASHVVQACLATLQPAVTLEHATPQHFYQHSHKDSSMSRKASSAAYASDTATIINQDGVLRSATQHILDIAEELSQDQTLLAGLVTDAFGSHVLRSLLCVLTGRNIQTDLTSSSATAGGDLRSKKSAQYRTRKAPHSTTTSVTAPEQLLVVIPDLLFDRSVTLRQEVLSGASVETIRRWATDAVASPLLQLLIETESDSLNADSDVSWKGSLIDKLLNGFITSPPQTKATEKDAYLETSLRDSIASHALQLSFYRAPISSARQFFSNYITGRMAKLCVHPAANHIVATLIRRLSTSDLKEAIAEMAKVASGMVKEGMIGCLQAAVERVVQLSEGNGSEESKELVKAVSEAVLAGFRLKSVASEGEEGLKLLVPSVMALKTRKAYLHTYAAYLKKREDGSSDPERGSKRGRDGKKKQHKKSKSDDQGSDHESELSYTMDSSYELPSSEATIQGSLLLQSLLCLPGPAAPPKVAPKRTFGRPTPPNPAAPVESWGSALVLDSLLSLPTLTPFAKNSTAVHVLLSALSTPTSSIPSDTAVFDRVQANRRRKLSTALTTTLGEFCGDKFGSRLADTLWYTVDGYSKEKIIKIVVANHDAILRGQYASYFTNKLNLQLYRKGKLREWKQAVDAQQQQHQQQQLIGKTGGGSKEKDTSHKAVVVETKRSKEQNSGKKGRKDKVDGQLDSILDQI
ncbi:related to NOP9 - essential subunit of U3-containing 90S pre-ribosome [Melanopsichium pennsylvanicum]|uniref:Nucleolar protein 9 n=2 Tax=Melanopsichium pennsylvanicum TaxID=63383 RepID=A0AAJ4XJG4_9BASI|nr:arm repeat-containing protein [Melanopsichium pennsylvanicum 4]SNX83769.1 related to NOP9 - essential subunit of U3-containing 90S pre-ribosome [Melanopsichium pennsylvanicum]